jgi:hypothetical protein
LSLEEDLAAQHLGKIPVVKLSLYALVKKVD